MGNKRMIPQHEVLRTPQGWTGQERDLIVQLERIHDDIYRRFRKIGMADLDDELSGIVKDTYEYEEYGPFSTENAVAAALDEIVSGMKVNSMKLIKIRGDANSGFLKVGYASACQIFKASSNTYARAIMYEFGTHDIVSGRRTNTGWTFKKLLIEE